MTILDEILAEAASALDPDGNPIDPSGPEMEFIRQRFDRLDRVESDRPEKEPRYPFGQRSYSDAPEAYRVQERPEANAYCKTGKGGGVDPSCGKGKKGTSTGAKASSKVSAKEKPEAKSKPFKTADPGAEKSIETLSKHTIVGVLMKAGTGVPEGYSVQQHTSMVHEGWDKIAAEHDLGQMSKNLGMDVPKVMRAAVTLHDIGKPLALISGDKNKNNQHQFTLPLLEDAMTKEGFSEKEVGLAKALVGHDAIGHAMRGWIKPEEGAQKLIDQAKQAGVPVESFVELAGMFYKADAMAYPHLKKGLFEEGTTKIKHPAYDAVMDAVGALTGKKKAPAKEAEPEPVKPAPKKASTEKMPPQPGAPSPAAGKGSLSKAKAAIAKAGLDPAQVAKAAQGKADPSAAGKQNLKLRNEATAQVLASETMVKDAALQVIAKQDAEARKAQVKSLITKPNSDVARALKDFANTPTYDIAVLGDIHPMNSEHPNRGSCDMIGRHLSTGTNAALGDMRHEMGHALRSSWSGDFYTQQTPLTKAVSNEYAKVQARFQANPPPKDKYGDYVKLPHEEYEEKYGVAGQRSLDNWEENAAEHYRLYHREIYRDQHEGGNGKFLAQYRKRHPGWARIWDAHYTVALMGLES